MARCELCDERAVTRGLCHTHDARWRRWGKPPRSEWIAAFREGRLNHCRICGNDFNGYHGAETCSPDCDAERRRRDALERWHGLPAEEKQTANARAKARRRQRSAAKKTRLTCPICGTQFHDFPHKKFDKPECRRANEAIQRRDIRHRQRLAQLARARNILEGRIHEDENEQ